jgi:hypothetical protein
VNKFQPMIMSYLAVLYLDFSRTKRILEKRTFDYNMMILAALLRFLAGWCHGIMFCRHVNNLFYYHNHT